MSKHPRHEETIAEVIARRRRRVADRAEAWVLLRRTALVALAFWLMFTQVFLITQVHGMDMFPAMKDGDLAIVYRLQGEYARDDVVVYQADGKRHIGRIAARGTDVVMVEEDGTLIVNGTVQSGEILYPTYPREGVTYPYRVPADSLFILGDYRTLATDSRSRGAVPLTDVEGKVITILRRRGI